MKYLREKSSDPRNTHEIKFVLAKYPREKNFERSEYPREKFRTSEGTVAPWHETHEIHGGTRPAKFSTLNKFVGSRPATLFKERLLHMCFPVNFSDLFGTVFYRTPVNGYLCFT